MKGKNVSKITSLRIQNVFLFNLKFPITVFVQNVKFFGFTGYTSFDRKLTVRGMPT